MSSNVRAVVRLVAESAKTSVGESVLRAIGHSMPSTAGCPASRCGPVALLVFLAAAAGTWIVPPDFGLVAAHRLHRGIVAADAGGCPPRGQFHLLDGGRASRERRRL